MKLNQQSLAGFPANLAVPGYDRSALRVGVVHFGVGGFHRSHQAMYLDRLMNCGQAHDWAICGVGLLSGDVKMGEALTTQDYLYTLMLKDAGGQRQARVIGSIIEYLYAPNDPSAVIARMTDPAVRIVSMTVTEGGYNVDHVAGEFNLAAPNIAHDLQRPARSRTVFGLVTEALFRRRYRGIAPFTVMSCDNVQSNGDVARTAFTSFAAARDAELGEWISREVAFPNSMVDRITPVTSDKDRAEVRLRFGIDDAWPVVAEPFEQWVLEDRFPQGRPPFEEAGVQVVADVEPYEMMKLRLLNATHQGMCYFGHLSGYRYAHEAAGDPVLARFLLDYMHKEATPTLQPVPGVDLEAYKTRLIERYRNPDIRDTLARLCADSSNRIPQWLVPVIRDQLAKGRRVTNSAAIVASWARYAEGIDEKGVPIDVVDQHKDALIRVARAQLQDPTAFIEQRRYFGDLVDNAEFVDKYTNALASLHAIGARATLEKLVKAADYTP